MYLSSRNYEEKRGFIRMKVDTPIAIHCAALNMDVNGMCRNLSGGGALVELESTLPLGASVELCISSQHGHSPMLNARAKVRRVDASLGEKKSPCAVGLEIIEVL